MLKKKLALVLAMALSLSLALPGCGNGTTSTPDSTSQSGTSDTSDTSQVEGSVVTGGREGGGTVTFATGGTSGTYYGFGGVLASTIGSATSTTVNYISSNGSQDNIYMMQDGRVAESGTHRQLLERRGQYEKLYRTQMELEQYGKEQYGKEAAV